MNPLRSRAVFRALGTLALAASTIVIAAPASAASGPCMVSGATLDWGFKESFRAYIDGSIANGEWTAADGASYATPSFSWADGTAEIDPSAHTTEVAFHGSVRFTGHEGILDTTIADPVVRIAADGTATVRLDVSGPTMEGDQVDLADVEFVTGSVDPGSVGAEGDQHLAIPAPALTTDGSTAFPNYEAGTAFDDLTLVLPATEDCRVELASADSPLGASAWVAVGVVSALVVAGVGVTVAQVRKRKRATDA
jgi:hypothetical protein